MNRLHLSVFSLAAVASLAISSVSHATPVSAVDFSESAPDAAITSTSFDSATVLSAVTVKCPAKGYLVATASANMHADTTATGNTVTVAYSIARDSFSTEGDTYFVFIDAAKVQPAVVQRTEACGKHKTYTFRFVANLSPVSPPFNQSDFGATALKPKLVVEYFRRKF
jgi:hypothetical protein